MFYSQNGDDSDVDKLDDSGDGEEAGHGTVEVAETQDDAVDLEVVPRALGSFDTTQVLDNDRHGEEAEGCGDESEGGEQLGVPAVEIETLGSFSRSFCQFHPFRGRQCFQSLKIVENSKKCSAKRATCEGLTGKGAFFG